MPTIISTQTKEFRFDDDFIDYDLENPHFIVTITVKELEYDNGSHYYDITYYSKFIPSNCMDAKTNNIFRSRCAPLTDGLSEGVIVYKNQLISKMIEYLLMDYEKMYEITGYSTVQQYKRNIMIGLMNFWD